MRAAVPRARLEARISPAGPDFRPPAFDERAELMDMGDYDVIVVGAGSPGEHCAGELADGGLHVAEVERELAGGECSYWACCPTATG